MLSHILRKIRYPLSLQVRRKIGLIVADNGRGSPDNYFHSKNDAFGMTLMRGMVEDLEGNFA